MSLEIDIEASNAGQLYELLQSKKYFDGFVVNRVLKKLADKKYFSESDSAKMKNFRRATNDQRNAQRECFQKLSPEAIEFLRSELKKEIYHL